MRLRDFAESWLQAQTQLRLRTRELYATQLRNHVYPRPEDQPLGRLWVHQVREDDITALIAEMRADSVSRRRRRGRCVRWRCSRLS